MKLLRFVKRNIPNSITCLNLLSGCLACVFSFSYDADFGPLKGYEMAFLFIGLATLFDFCDGLSARLLHAYSALGKELDSLSDLVCFGLAPAMLVFNTMMRHDAGWLSYLAFFITICGALRLAKFNIDDRQTTTFIGLPIPANAIFWIGIIAWNMQFGYMGNGLMAVLSILFPLLMLSRMRMFSLKVHNFAFQNNVRRYALVLGAVLFLVFQHLSGLAWTIVLYIFLSATARKNEQV